jgi:hypothetical protein
VLPRRSGRSVSALGQPPSSCTKTKANVQQQHGRHGDPRRHWSTTASRTRPTSSRTRRGDRGGAGPQRNSCTRPDVKRPDRRRRTVALDCHFDQGGCISHVGTEGTGSAVAIAPGTWRARPRPASVGLPRSRRCDFVRCARTAICYHLVRDIAKVLGGLREHRTARGDGVYSRKRGSGDWHRAIDRFRRGT